MKLRHDLVYDRRLSPEFLAYFCKDGFARRLVDYAKSGLFPLDLRPRRDSKSKAEHMTLYVGLTAVLHVKSTAGGQIRLDAHKTHRKAAGFDDAWAEARPAEEWVDLWPEVEAYLERIIPVATQSHGLTEGAVQAAIGSYRATDMVVLDREVTPSFRDSATKKRILDSCRDPIHEACRKADLGFGKGPKDLGAECDAIAIDRAGRILAIEVKPLRGGTIPWVPAQALMYARVLQRWVDEDPSAGQVLRDMAKQRNKLGLAPAWASKVEVRPEVVPVVAVQRGATAEAVRRMVTVRDALRAAELGGVGIELKEVSLIGELLDLEDSRVLPGGSPRSVGASYAARENDRNTAWKQTTSTLPDDARVDDRAPYYLPEKHAALNLLPEVRESVLAIFKDIGIPWHHGTKAGPSRHLRSSQVQCANALGAMIHDPSRIERAFGDVLDIESVRDFGEIDPKERGRFLTFEFNGTKDHLNEKTRQRGAQSTSVDAAFAYRTADGRDALALVEWKYTETYPSAGRDGDRKLKERTRRYGDLLRADDSPVDVDGVELPDLFHDPIYQLVRQQLLASRIERDGDENADLVHVVHVLSPLNVAYQRSYVAPALRSRGDDIDTVWRSLLRTPDRFVKLDPAVFLDPAITSTEYVARYGEQGSTTITGAG